MVCMQGRCSRTFGAPGEVCKHAFAVAQNSTLELLVRHIEWGAGSRPHGRNVGQQQFARIHIDPLGCTTHDIGASVAPGRQARRKHGRKSGGA